MSIVLFILGLAVGSFINVIAVRYDPNSFILTRRTLGGRSRCPHCGKVLSWYELIPVLSFILQSAKCRACAWRLSVQYPISEILSGIIFVSVPAFLHRGTMAIFLPDRVGSILWIAVFTVLLLISLIDIRLKIIPDELSAALLLLGIFISMREVPRFSLTGGSFIGPYALMFGLRSSLFFNRAAAVIIALLFFGFIIAVSRGRGMGVGDLKLAGVLGLVFGWPDILILSIFGFIVGSLAGVYFIYRKRAGMKSYLPFGPFLSIGAYLIFGFGRQIIEFYFNLVHLG